MRYVEEPVRGVHVVLGVYLVKVMKIRSRLTAKHRLHM